MTERMFEVSYKPGEEVVVRFHPPVFPFLPEEARGHLRQANKEFLLALRSLIDKGIEELEKKGKKPAKEKIPVQ